MTDAWPRSETVRAARDLWLNPGVVTDGYRGVSVSEVDDGLLLTFQWRRDPNTYALLLPWPGTPEDDGQGLETSSAEDWAFEKTRWLAEEVFATNFTRRAQRIKRNGIVQLERPSTASGRGYDYYVTDVPVTRFEGAEQVRNVIRQVFPATVVPPDFQWSALDTHLPGSWLAGFGLDVSLPRRRLEERRLIAWLQAMDNPSGIRVVGHASVSWHPELPDSAVIDVLQVLAGIPRSVSEDLILNAFCSARESGALRVVTSLADPLFGELGFHSTPSDGLVRETLD